MSKAAANPILQQISRIVEDHRLRGAADSALLGLLGGQDNQAAFQALVLRHGPMVLDVCRSVLMNESDIEDAFQATFLILARKVASIRKAASLSSWLHGVAYRTALKAKADFAKRVKHESRVSEKTAATADEPTWREVRQVLHEELSRIPERDRAPLVLCYVQGMTQDEAAAQLGLAKGALRGRLERGRALLRKRLMKRGLGPTMLAVFAAWPGANTFASPTPLVAATVAMASIGKGVIGIGSERVTVLSEEVMNHVAASKLTGLIYALAVAVVVGIGAAVLVPGRGPMSHASAGSNEASLHANRDAPKVEPDIEKLIRQLGASNFTEREAAEKELRGLGAKAAAAVRTGMGAADAEIAKRCEAVWPRLWESEIKRPDADRLAGYDHPLWKRFRKTIGDDPSSRTLYAEMVADVRRFNQLETVEANHAKAGDAYAEYLKQLVERMKQAYKDAEAAARDLSGLLWPYGGIPSRGEFAMLLFLGTYPPTAAVTFRQADDHDRVAHHNVFGLPFHSKSPAKDETIPPALRRLFAAWLATRTDPNPIAFGLNLALYHNFSEAAPAARASAANGKLDPRTRGFAVLAVGRFGTADDLPLLEKALSDTRMFHATNYTSETNQKRPVEAQVGDAALAAVLRVAGQHPADFGFPLLEMYKERGPDTLAKYHLLGFFDDATRQATHKKAMEWLEKYKSDNPVPKPALEPDR